MDQLDGALTARIDIMSWYNFTTFDIIGLVKSSGLVKGGLWHLADRQYRDLSLGESFHCLEKGDSHDWMRYLVDFRCFEILD